MKIKGIGCSFPERIVSNKEILQIIEKNSAASFKGNLDQSLQKIQFLLERAGMSNRRWIDSDDNSFNHIYASINEAINNAQVEKSDIDLLIYCSVDRQVREPATSFLLAKALGLEKVECFDILEACAGWIRATQVAQAYLKLNTYQNILIVTSEFNCHEGSWGHSGFNLSKEEDLSWSFATYTIGEGATATILSKDENNPWGHEFESRPEYAHLCMAPICDSTHSANKSMLNLNLSGVDGNKFISRSQEMQTAGIPLILSLMKKKKSLLENTDIVIPHSHTKKTWLDVAESLGVDLPYFFICEDYGNLVTGSIPSGIALAVKQGKLKRTQNVTAMMTAAGLSFSIVDFKF